MNKMIVNMDGLNYEDRLQSLNLWSLEERLNRQDLIEVFEMAKGMTRIRPVSYTHLTLPTKRIV